MKGVRASCHGAQQRTDGARGKFAPFDSHAFTVSTRDIRLNYRSLLARPWAREQSDFKSAVGSNHHRCLDVRTADAQIGQPAVSFGEGVRHESDRKIDLNSFSPAVIHECMVPREVSAPYKNSVQLPRDISYSCTSIPRQ